MHTDPLTQARAAKLLGISPSRVSDLVRGKWEKFSLEMLVTLATRAGLHVTVKTAAQTMLANQFLITRTAKH